MDIYLDGDKLPGYDHRVTAQGQIDRKDLSGESSSTAAAYAGWKPWLLSVRTRIDFDRPDALLELRTMFEAAQETEQTTPSFDAFGTPITEVSTATTLVPKLWEITDDTAAALDIFHVRFADAMQVEPDAEQRRWEVTLHLVQERSTPEKAEERLPAATQPAPAAPDATDTTGAAATAATGALATVEAVLAKANNFFGQTFYGVKPK